MDIRTLTDTYSVTPQISPDDMTTIAQAGFKSVICNRPDAENPPAYQISEMEKAASDAGLALYLNPFPSPMMSMEHVTEQARLLTNADGPVLAYCASGTRSCRVWALSQAGQMPVDDIINAGARAGYQLNDLRSHIMALANS
ncbi:TIGR01244 family sulfur transferase [Parasulfitobacter algicola]|uniref:TIGR01244 family phosphatase n=1 Tax=Parasulfitobacter algicola TaxID=2614809 RepID=A0ABX2IXY2_9RHOB|nr:TIGR01244 family sulfur transferase [Sulfitobacter algicola]NSX55258.1 TIGR01244 family phosphatase [Sulfitobacter algicola]